MIKVIAFLAILLPLISAIKFPIASRRDNNRELFPIPGAEDCGTNAEMHDISWAVNCQENPCHIDPNEEHLIRFDFSPAADHNRIDLFAYYIVAFPIPIIQLQFDGPFYAHNPYRIEFDLLVPDIFRGQTIGIRAIVPSEFCVNFPIHIID